jgi:hypothetical protein
MCLADRPISYYLIDFIGIAAVIFCLFSNFWILIAALVSCGSIQKSYSSHNAGRASVGVGIVVCAALFYDPLLFLGTLIALCIWTLYGPEYRRQFDKIDYEVTILK